MAVVGSSYPQLSSGQYTERSNTELNPQCYCTTTNIVNMSSHNAWKTAIERMQVSEEVDAYDDVEYCQKCDTESPDKAIITPDSAAGPPIWDDNDGNDPAQDAWQAKGIRPKVNLFGHKKCINPLCGYMVTEHDKYCCMKCRSTGEWHAKYHSQDCAAVPFYALKKCLSPHCGYAPTYLELYCCATCNEEPSYHVKACHKIKVAESTRSHPIRICATPHCKYSAYHKRDYCCDKCRDNQAPPGNHDWQCQQQTVLHEDTNVELFKSFKGPVIQRAINDAHQQPQMSPAATPPPPPPPPTPFPNAWHKYAPKQAQSNQGNDKGWHSWDGQKSTSGDRWQSWSNSSWQTRNQSRNNWNESRAQAGEAEAGYFDNWHKSHQLAKEVILRGHDVDQPNDPGPVTVEGDLQENPKMEELEVVDLTDGFWAYATDEISSKSHQDHWEQMFLRINEITEAPDVQFHQQELMAVASAMSNITKQHAWAQALLKICNMRGMRTGMPLIMGISVEPGSSRTIVQGMAVEDIQPMEGLGNVSGVAAGQASSSSGLSQEARDMVPLQSTARSRVVKVVKDNNTKFVDTAPMPLPASAGKKAKKVKAEEKKDKSSKTQPKTHSTLVVTQPRQSKSKWKLPAIPADEPWITLKTQIQDGHESAPYTYCSLCGCWATDEHIKSLKHKKRTDTPEYYGWNVSFDSPTSSDTDSDESQEVVDDEEDDASDGHPPPPTAQPKASPNALAVPNMVLWHGHGKNKISRVKRYIHSQHVEDLFLEMQYYLKDQQGVTGHLMFAIRAARKYREYHNLYEVLQAFQYHKSVTINAMAHAAYAWRWKKGSFGSVLMAKLYRLHKLRKIAYESWAELIYNKIITMDSDDGDIDATEE